MAFFGNRQFGFGGNRQYHGPGQTRFDSRGFDRYGFGHGIGGRGQPGNY